VDLRHRAGHDQIDLGSTGATDQRQGIRMANHTYVINEIVGTSPDGVNQAIKNGVARASQTLRNLDWFEVVSVRGAIADGEITHYQVAMKVGMRLDDAG
jgi:flavin-binding protein dodecin